MDLSTINFSRYNAKDTVVTIDGVVITGFGEDMVSIEKEEALAENVVGAQGDVVRSEINNSIYNITITVQPTCPQLSHLVGLKDRTEPFSIWVINKSLKIKAGGTKGYISEMPEIALGAEAEDIEFSITVLDGDISTETE